MFAAADAAAPVHNSFSKPKINIAARAAKYTAH